MQQEIIDVAAKAVNKSVLTQDKTQEQPLPTNAQKPLIIGFLILLMGFGGFIAWSVYAPLDSGVPSSGTVVLDTSRKTVQHLSGGVVKKIYVREGETIKEGSIVMQMDDSVALATKSSTQAQLKSLDIQIAFLNQLVSDLQSMTNEGFYPRNRLLELQRQRAEAESQHVGLRDKLAAASLELERAIVRSPASGTVMGVTITTEGAVVAPGAKLMEVVPANEQLVVEAQIQPHLIDKVVPGLRAEVRFSALNLRTTPVIVGTVEWVSGDKFQNPQDMLNPMGFYLARVIVSAAEIRKIPDGQIRPGMPADVIINTGERTFFDYLMKPLTDRMATSLKEH